MPTLHAVHVTTPAELRLAQDIRFKVFVDEQKVPAEEELEYEDESRHFLVFADGIPVATARWRRTAEGKAKIERCATLEMARGTGAGRAAVLAAIDDIPRELPIYLHAQTSAKGFYDKLGFLPEGDLFHEAGIEHIRMVLKRS